MRCEEFFEQLRSAAPLTEELAERLAGHLDNCRVCRRQVEEKEVSMRTVLLQAFADVDPDETEDVPAVRAALEGLESRVLARLNQPQVSKASTAPMIERLKDWVFIQIGPFTARSPDLQPMAANAYLSTAPPPLEQVVWELKVPAPELQQATQAAPWWDGTLRMSPRPHGRGAVRLRLHAGIASDEKEGLLRVSLSRGDKSWTVHLSWHKPTAYLGEDFPAPCGPDDFEWKVAVSAAEGE